MWHIFRGCLPLKIGGLTDPPGPHLDTGSTSQTHESQNNKIHVLIQICTQMFDWRKIDWRITSTDLFTRPTMIIFIFDYFDFYLFF